MGEGKKDTLQAGGNTQARKSQRPTSQARHIPLLTAECSFTPRRLSYLATPWDFQKPDFDCFKWFQSKEVSYSFSIFFYFFFLLI